MNTRIISLFSIVMVAFCMYPSEAAESPLYKPRVDYEIVDVRCTAIADLDGNGGPDLIISSDTYISVLLGNGSGSFLGPIVSSGGAPKIALDDLDGDGVPDLIKVRSNGNIQILLGNGDGTFQTEVQYSVGEDPRDVAIGDLDGDGIQDLVTVNEGHHNISVLLGNGDGTFQDPVHYWTMDHASRIVMEDFDGDGHADLAVSSYLGQVRILLGYGDATFQDAALYQVTYGIYSVDAGDLNGDSVPDLVTANFVSECILVSLGNGDGTFQAPTTYEIEGYPLSVAIADHDGDSIPDLVTGNQFNWDEYEGSTVAVLLGNGDGTFLPPLYHETGFDSSSAIVGDLNNDGKQDAVVKTRYYDEHISVLINRSVPDMTLYITDFSCVPMHGTVPFDTRMSLTLLNRAEQTRQIATRIQLNLANGQSIGNWKAGYLNIVGGARTTSTWFLTIPALRSVIGSNRFTAVAEDVTPAPWNQPPFPSSGYQDIAGINIIAARP